MEFDKSRVYTSVNADELKAGDKVIVANTLKDLKSAVDTALYVYELTDILTESSEDRFFVNDRCYLLAYLVERKENCTNCALCERTNASDDEEYECSPQGYIGDKERAKTCRCSDWILKTETPELISLGNGQYAERKHYRPFRDTDELIKVWREKSKQVHSDYSLTMPYIWVRRKEANTKGQLITEFGDGWGVGIGRGEAYNMTDLLVHFTFLDGSVCGVEE